MISLRRVLVLGALGLVAVGSASYAVAGSLGGPGDPPNSKHFKARLNGFQETPSISTTGFGEFNAELNKDGTSLHYVFQYGGLEGQNVTGGKILFAHVHFGERAVAGGVSFFLCDNSAVPATPHACPDDNGSGTVEGDITAADVIGPNGQGIEPGSFGEAIRAMQAGQAYANIHTTRWPGGEIRGQINNEDQKQFDK